MVGSLFLPLLRTFSFSKNHFFSGSERYSVHLSISQSSTCSSHFTPSILPPTRSRDSSVGFFSRCHALSFSSLCSLFHLIEDPDWSATSRVPPTDPVLLESSPPKAGSIVVGRHLATVSNHNGTTMHHCSCNPKSREVLERQDYRVYRYRCRQYRICTCSVLQTRSISSDASLVLELGTDAHPNQGHHQSRNPVPSQPDRTGTRLEMPGMHSCEDVGLERISSPQPANPWEAATLDTAHLAAGDTLSDTAGLYSTGQRLHKSNLATTTGRTKPLYWYVAYS